MATAKKSTKETAESTIKETKKKQVSANPETIAQQNNAEAEIGVDKNIENDLIALYKLQTTYSKIDKVRVVRGELPLEVSDLEDICQGLQTRLSNFAEIVKETEATIAQLKEDSKESQNLIAKYKEQLDNVRNNREYEALCKEIEYEDLQIKVNERKINENNATLENKQNEIEDVKKELSERQEELKVKSGELQAIIAETEKDEKQLLAIAEKQSNELEPRLLKAFNRIRNSMRNGLATVKIERNACGGCFSKISPQRQLDIQMHKKIIICEFCGRILVDDRIVKMSEESTEDK